MRRALLAVLIFALLAPAAQAHVTIVPSAARPGQSLTLTFQVLNERSDQKTVGVDVFLPAGVSGKPGSRPGWTVLAKGAQISWSTDSPDAAIGGETSKDFELTVGPLPKGADRVVFKVLQHYSDGQVVRWIQDPDPSSERPAPALELTASGRPGAAAASSSSSAAGFAILAAILVAALGAATLLVRRRSRQR